MTLTDPAPASPQATASRPVSPVTLARSKPLLRGWLHLLWFEASLVAGTLLMARAHGPLRTAASAIFAVSVSTMFGASALYHRGTWSDAWRRRLQRMDHAMIFLLIGGTATPAFLLATHGTVRLACLSVLWALILAAATGHMLWMNAPELLVGGTFIGLGWVAALSVPAIWAHDGVLPASLMLTGGVLYMAGAFFYHRRRPDPNPAVFGYHEVFHVFVAAAATCQYVAIALFVI